MLIRHVSLSEIQRLALEIGVTFEGTDIGVKFPRVRGRLIPDRSVPKEDRNYPRVSAGFGTQGRNVFAVCWHGHRDFFRHLFEDYPEATVNTGLATMAGIGMYTSENFENVFPDTNINIGPPIFPVYAAEACKCPEGSF